MKKAISLLKFFFFEVMILCAYLLLVNNYIGQAEKTINADGIGYYDYLPSVFIHHDMVRKDHPFEPGSDLYKRIEHNIVYVNYGKYKLDKYPCGTALLQLPFFMGAYYTNHPEGNEFDGYQDPFQRTVFYATLFYLFLSLFFLRKILILHKVPWPIIVLCQVLLVFGTSVTHYANADAGFSHIYSMFAITAFMYFVSSYFKKPGFRSFIFACLFLALIVLLRQINILVVFLLPFLAGSWENFKAAFRTLFHNKKWLITGMLVVIGITFIQCVFWYLQTGEFILYSYQNERFYFTNPQIINILFSYKKGLFVYTPVLFIAVLSLIWFLYKRRYFMVITWFSFFALLTYVLSSWESWEYGCSYGLRAYIDFYAVFFIPFGVMLGQMGLKTKIAIATLSLLTIPVNVIQAYQYKVYILHWSDMDKTKYWKVFLKTNEKYKGLVWKKQYDMNHYSVVKQITVGDMRSSINKTDDVIEFYSHEIPEFDRVNIIQVAIDNDFNDKSDSRFIISIKESGSDTFYYWHEVGLMHFSEMYLNEWQTGVYNYEYNPVGKKNEYVIALGVHRENQQSELKNIRLRFLKKNY